MYKLSSITTVLLLSTLFIEANVSGIVFKDLPLNGNNINNYGLQEANEKGLSGVTVNAFPDGLSTVTDENGSWSLNTTSAKVRIEFSNWSSFLKESPIGNNNKSSVQFINNNETATLALHNPKDYSNNNPLLATTHFINGKSSLNTPEPTIYSWPYNNSGKPNNNQQTVTSTDNVRSVWGLAYDKTNKKLYSSSFLKRHVSIGINGLGAIYMTNFDDNTTALFQTVPNTGTIEDDTSRGLDEANLPNIDKNVFKQIAKVGLGDIAISEDKSTLYTVNLNNKKIYEIDTTTSNIITSYAVPGPVCNNGELRPFAITVHENNLYVGSVCDASTANCTVTENSGYCADLTAQVYKVALGSTVGSEIFKMRLDYKKELIHTVQTKPTRHNWNPWTDNYSEITIANRVFHPTPILSNIKFDEDNNMFLAFSDRITMQTASEQFDINGSNETVIMSGGDILKAKHENNNSYTLLDINLYDDNTSVSIHEEGALGAVAYIKGSNEIVFTEYDPYNEPGFNPFDTKGVTFNNASTGERTRSYAVAAENLPTYFGKGTSIGDLEIITDAAPTEIGNRVWFDENANCTQDANESGIDGIKLQLLDENNNVIDSQTTSNGGTYLFTNITPNKNHIVRVENTNQPELNNKKIATNCASIANTLINSDAIQNGSSADVTVLPNSIKIAGANNYSFDIGFQPKAAPLVTPTYSLGDYVWLDANHDGVQDANESGRNGVKVNLYHSNDCSGSIAETQNTVNGGTPAQDGFYQFTGLTQGNYCVEFILPAGYSVSPQNSIADDARNSDADTNSAQIRNIDLQADTLAEDIGIFQTPVATPTYSLGDYVWLDANHDGVQDANESGRNGVKVNLYHSNDCSGSVAETQNTVNGGTPAQDGFYQFTGLTQGNYCVEFVLPNGFSVSPQNSIADDARNSDADTNSAQIRNIDLQADTLAEDVGIYTNNPTAVAAVSHTDGTCTCHPYKESSVSLFNMIAIILTMMLTSMMGIMFSKDS